MALLSAKIQAGIPSQTSQTSGEKLICTYECKNGTLPLGLS